MMANHVISRAAQMDDIMEAVYAQDAAMQRDLNESLFGYAQKKAPGRLIHFDWLTGFNWFSIRWDYS